MRLRSGTAVAVLGLVLCAAYVWLTHGSGHIVAEWVLGESPQARLEDFMQAIQRDDRKAALACWRAAGLAGDDARHIQVTDGLVSLGPGVRYRILMTQWWAAWCCEPGLVEDPGLANVARLQVEITNSKGHSRQYVFEVRARAILGSEPPGGRPVRCWALADVYPADGNEPGVGWPPPPHVLPH